MKFLKVVINGKAGTTDVVNILYYGSDVNLPGDYSASDMQALGNAVRDAWQGSVTAYLGEGYRVDLISVSQVNEENVTTGAATVQVAGASGTGNGGATDGRAITVPVSFILERVVDVNPIRVPKRSYLAIGPLGSAVVDSEGNFNPGTPQEAGLNDALSQGHLVNLKTFEPYRVGVVNANGIPAVGKVIGIRIARRVSVRRSRLDR